MNRDKSVRESNICSSGRSASLTERMYVFMRWVKPIIFCLAILYTLSFCYWIAAVFSVDAGRVRNSNDDFLKAPALSDGCNSVHTPLRKSNKLSDSGQNKVS